MKNTLLLGFALFPLLFTACREENPHEVERNKSGKYILENENGDVVIAATKGLYNYDQIYFLIVDSAGEFKSSYRFGLTGDEVPVSLGQNYNGNYVVLTNSLPAHTNTSHCRFVLCESNGKPIAFKEVTKNDQSDHDFYTPTAMVRNVNNTYTIVGNLNNEGEEEPFFARLLENGFLEWIKSPEFVNNRKVLGVATTTIGENVLAGAVSNKSLLFKIDKKGEFVWSRSYNFLEESEAQNIYQTKSKSFVIVGRCGFGFESTYLLKTNEQGDSLWSSIYNGELAENSGLQITEDNGCVLALNQIGRFSLIKNDSHGELVWEKSIKSELGTANVNSLLALNDGGFLVTGDILNINGIRYIYISKFDAEGNQLWETGL